MTTNGERRDPVDTATAVVGAYLCPSCSSGPLILADDLSGDHAPATCTACGAIARLRHDETFIGDGRIAYHGYRIQHDRWRDVDLWGRIKPLPTRRHENQRPSAAPDPNQLDLL